MSSIFSYDPAPPHPSSPWDKSAGSSTPGGVQNEDLPLTLLGSKKKAEEKKGLRPTVLGEGKPLGVGMKGLVSEPQLGSTEYKLHLLKEGKTHVRLEQLTTQMLWRLQQSNPYVPISDLTQLP